MENVLFIIDEIEYKYFEFNVLVTNFWLIKTFLQKGHDVFVTTKTDLFTDNGEPYALCARAHLTQNNIVKESELNKTNLNGFDVIFMRSDPPVDIDFINATYVLDSVTDSLILNSPSALRNINEKLYINKFPSVSPENIVTSNSNLIKEFLFEKKEIIIKPLNKCFSSGVFYLNREDKNINAIINTATDNNKTKVMVQEFLQGISKGDRRLIFINGKIMDYAVSKVATNNDFKFVEHKLENLTFAPLTKEQKEMENVISKTLLEDGVYMAGLDVIENKIIEINITSPCFFINEINNLYKINFEEIIYDNLSEVIKTKGDRTLLTKC